MVQLLNMALVLGTLGCGAMAGIYYAFSGFIMRALDTTGPETATPAMVAINQIILGSGFMVLFFGTSLLCLVLLIAALILQPPGHRLIAGAAGTYLLGMLAVTMLRNVPLNQALAIQGVPAWPDYLRDWSFWNHIRTAASAVAAAGFGTALLAQS